MDWWHWPTYQGHTVLLEISILLNVQSIKVNWCLIFIFIENRGIWWDWMKNNILYENIIGIKSLANITFQKSVLF